MTEQVDVKQLFEACLTEGKDKAATMRYFVENGVDVVTAVSEYRKLAREAGLTLTRAERATKITDILLECDLTSDRGIQEAEDSLMAALDFSRQTAVSHIKTFATVHGIEAPFESKKKNLADKKEVVAYLIENEILDAKTMAKGLVDEFGYKLATANSIVSMHQYMKEYHRQKTNIKNSAKKAA
jgi:hypothetical protein